MIWHMIELTAIFVECFIMSRFLIRYFQFKTQTNIILKQMLLLLILSAIDYLGTGFNLAHIIGFILACIVLAAIFLNGTLLEKVFISLMGCILFPVINLPILTLFSTFTNKSVAALIEAQDITRIWILIITKLLYFFFTQMILLLKEKHAYYFSRLDWNIVILSMMITNIIGILIFDIICESSQGKFLNLTITILVSAMNVFILIFIQKMSVGNRCKKENEFLEVIIAQKKTNTQNLCQQYEETQKIRHDMKNYVACALELIREKNYTQAEEYLESFMNQKIGTLKKFVNTSSDILNAVINSKLSLAEDAGITVRCVITEKVIPDMEFDMSILISNLLDNAIEACSQNQVPSNITLEISNCAGYLNILLSNTIVSSVLRDNSELRTTKPDQKSHGFGLKSVQEIVQNYDGMMDIYEENQTFVVSVMLKMK